MRLETTSSDLSLIKILYDILPHDGKGTLEIITSDGETHTQPTWHDIELLHEKYGQLTLTYNPNP